MGVAVQRRMAAIRSIYLIVRCSPPNVALNNVLLRLDFFGRSFVRKKKRCHPADTAGHGGRGEDRDVRALSAVYRRISVYVAASALLVASAGAAVAHHSGAMFDTQKIVKVDAVVKELQWTNPHGWLQVMIPDQAGKAEEWSLELTSPNILRRYNWGPSTMKAGDKVQVELNPMRDGSRGGRLAKVTLPDGTILGGQGPVR